MSKFCSINPKLHGGRCGGWDIKLIQKYSKICCYAYVYRHPDIYIQPHSHAVSEHLTLHGQNHYHQQFAIRLVDACLVCVTSPNCGSTVPCLNWCKSNCKRCPPIGCGGMTAYRVAQQNKNFSTTYQIPQLFFMKFGSEFRFAGAHKYRKRIRNVRHDPQPRLQIKRPTNVFLVDWYNSFTRIMSDVQWHLA